MLDITKLSELIFDDDRINNATAVKILAFNIQQLEKNNADKIYDKLIADSKTALDQLIKVINSADQSIHGRISATKTKAETIETIKTEASKLEALMHATFGRGSAEYLTVFSGGLVELHRAKEKNIPILLTRFKEAAEKYKGKIGDKMSESFAALSEEYQRVAGSQTDEKGNISNVRNERDTARHMVNAQLQRNLYSILANRVGEGNVLAGYFDLSLHPKSRISKKSTEGQEVVKPVQPSV